MSIINKINIDKLKVNSAFKPYIAEALIELDNHFDEIGWDKFLSSSHLNNLYSFTISEFGDEKSSSEGEVDFDEKTLKVKNMKDIAVLKHELLHALKGEKIVSGVQMQGVKIITNENGRPKEIGRNLEEYLNEMMVGESGDHLYRDGADIVKLLYAIVGDGLVKASFNNDRSQVEDIFYDLTGSDEFLEMFEKRLSLVTAKNSPDNEVYMMAPAVLLIELYESIRTKQLTNTDLTKDDALKMLEQDKKIREILKSFSYGNLTEICLNIFNKKMSDLYKSDAIYELDYKASSEFEKTAKLTDKKDLSFVNPQYEVSALSGGDVLRDLYINQIKDAITDGEFKRNEEGLRKFIETMKHFQKYISLAIEENKEKQEMLDLDLPLFECDLTKAEETAFANNEYKRIFKMISIHLFGDVDEDFINKFSNPNLISDSEIAKQNMEKRIELFSTYIKTDHEV